MDVNGLYVRHYDGIESVVPREETYLLTPEKFESDCAYILQCEERLVGQAVVARNEQDGMFHLGTWSFIHTDTDIHKLYFSPSANVKFKTLSLKPEMWSTVMQELSDALIR